MTEFVIKQGDLLGSGADALVNATNTKGVMGAGIAAQFKARWPGMFAQYRELSEIDSLYTQSVHVWWNPARLEEREPRWAGRLEPRWVINLHTKDDYADPSRYTYVVEGLLDLRNRLLEDLIECRTIAVPPLGCGLGGLDWKIVEVLTRDILGNVEHTGRVGLEVWLYPPADGRPGEPLQSGFNYRSEERYDPGSICTCAGPGGYVDPNCPWHGGQ